VHPRGKHFYFSFLAQLTSTREPWRKLAFPRIVIWRQGPVRLRFSLHQDANLPVLKWTSTGVSTEAAQGVSLQRANFVPIAEAPLPRTSEVSSEPISISTLHDWVDSSAHSHFFLKCTPATAAESIPYVYYPQSNQGTKLDSFAIRG